MLPEIRDMDGSELQCGERAADVYVHSSHGFHLALFVELLVDFVELVYHICVVISQRVEGTLGIQPPLPQLLDLHHKAAMEGLSCFCPALLSLR